MKLVSYTSEGKEAVGVWEDQSIFPLASLVSAAGLHVNASGHTMAAVLEDWNLWQPVLADLSRRPPADRLPNPLSPAEVKLLAPLPRPGKILMAGANY